MIDNIGLLEYFLSSFLILYVAPSLVHLANTLSRHTLYKYFNVINNPRKKTTFGKRCFIETYREAIKPVKSTLICPQLYLDFVQIYGWSQ